MTPFGHSEIPAPLGRSLRSLLEDEGVVAEATHEGQLRR